MKKSFILLFVLSLSVTLLSTRSAEAREWTIMGPRALGMGGAGVAVTNDASASYWNPAAYGFFSDKEKKKDDYGKRDLSATLPVGIGVSIHENLGEEIDKILQFNFANISGGGGIPASGVSDFLQLVNELQQFDANENRAINATLHGGLAIQVGHFGIGGYAFGDISARGDLDLINISPFSTGGTFTVADFTDPTAYGYAGTSGVYTYYDQPGSPASADVATYLTGTLGWSGTDAQNFVDATDYGLTQAVAGGTVLPPDILTQIQNVAALGDLAAGSGGELANNESALIFRGLLVAEFPVTYGRAFGEKLAIGGNIKAMQARAYNTKVTVFDTNFSNALDAAQNSYIESSTFGVDLGALYRPNNWLRLGIVGRNLNSPTFEMIPLTPGGEDSIKDSMQIRAGLALKPLNSLTLAADLDLTQNESTIPSLTDKYKSQNVGVGLEYSLLNFLKIRGGAYTNIAESDIGPVLTAGLGLNLWLMHIDIGGALSTETSQIDSSDIPKTARLEVALSMLF